MSLPERSSVLPILFGAGLILVIIAGSFALWRQGRTIDRLDAQLARLERASLGAASTSEVERRISELQDQLALRARRIVELDGVAGQMESTANDPAVADPEWREALVAEIDELRDELAVLSENRALGTTGVVLGPGGEGIPVVGSLPLFSGEWGYGQPLLGNVKAPSWGPNQAIGAPDTNGLGDFPTAWASQEPDGGIEWLEIRFAAALVPDGVVIVESYHPGAVVKVEARGPSQGWRALWSGQDPSTAEANELFVPFSHSFEVDAVRVTLDTRLVQGWNEIDAVGLTIGDETEWGSEATASSTYANR